MLSSFEEKTGKKGKMISAVDLLKGIAVGAYMSVADVEGANGGLHTNYEGKMQAAVDALTKEAYDFVYVHVEAPDEMGHQGSVEKKVKAIEYLAADGHNRLKRRVARLLARAESRIALHDEKLADVDITASAVNKLLHAVGKVV